MKVRDLAMLKLHKSYLIPFSVDVTKKLAQQYVDFFQIVKKVGWLAYKLKVPSDWKIYLVFSITQLELAPNQAEDPFHRLCL